MTFKRSLAVVIFAGFCGGCRQDMHDQPKYLPYRPSEFFADYRSERQPVSGTIAAGTFIDDPLLETGKVDGNDSPVFPFAIDVSMMQRGRERFEIFCSPCHGRTGDGNGMVVQRGYRQPPSYHIDRLRDSPPGHFFDVMTNGFGAMPDYAVQVAPRDRWAIAAYIRALQLSEHASVAQVPPDARTTLERSRP